VHLAFYKKYKVKTPIKNNIYNIRTISRNSNGDLEVLLEEIINVDVPIKHPILGISWKEVAWDLKRFRTLSQEVITEEMIQELKQTIKI